jgi:hypothetical protein
MATPSDNSNKRASASADADVSGWTLRAHVPEWIFTLAVEADDDAAAAEHAAFADRCAPLLSRAAAGDPAGAADLRAALLGQLADLRARVARSGVGYLGAVTGERGDGRPALVLLAVAATPMTFPAAVDAASLLAAMLRGEYPDAVIEEFETAAGTAVGLRRTGLEPAVPPGPRLQATWLPAAISQALVPFPEAGLLGAVTAYCLDTADVDVATVFSTAISLTLQAVPVATQPREDVVAG